MSKSMQQIVVGAILIVVAVAALISIAAGPETAFESGRRVSMSSKTFPTILAAGLGILSTLFTATALVRFNDERRRGLKPAAGFLAGLVSRTSLIAVAVIALLLAYAFLLKTVHFALLTFLFLLIGFYLFGQRRLLMNLVVSAGGMAAFYAIFVFILHLPLNP